MPYKNKNFKTKAFLDQTRAIVKGVNSLAGAEVCYMDSTGNYTFIEFTDKSKITAINTKNGWSYVDKYIKKMAKTHQHLVDYAKDNLYIIRDGEKIINPHMATLTRSLDYDVGQEVARLKSFIETIKPQHRAYLQQGGDGCWHVNGLIQHTLKRVKDIEASGTNIKQLNDYLYDGMKCNNQIIYPKKVKNILNDILTIVRHNSMKEITNGNLPAQM